MDDNLIAPQSAQTPPSPTQNSTVSPKEHKSIAKIFLLTLLVIILILGSGYGAYKIEHSRAVKVEKSQQAQIASLQTKVSSLQKQVSSSSSSSTTNQYAGWKTYTLTYEKLTLMYPSSWAVSDQSTTSAKHDDVTFNASDNFSFSISDGIQNGGDPLPLVSSNPVAVKFLGNPAYLVFVNPKLSQTNGSPTTDTSVVGSAILLTNANNQASFPADKNVIGSSQYNGVNGPEGSYMLINVGYNGKNNMPIQAAKTDSEYKNSELVIQSMHY